MNILELKSLSQVIIKDRVALSLIIALIIVSLAFCVYVSVSVQSSSAQVVVRYTGFGSTHYYRDSWTYLLSFVGFGVFTAFLNSAIAVKFIALEKRSLGLAWLIASIALVVIAAVLIHSVIGVKYL